MGRIRFDTSARGDVVVAGEGLFGYQRSYLFDANGASRQGRAHNCRAVAGVIKNEDGHRLYCLSL